MKKWLYALLLCTAIFLGFEGRNFNISQRSVHADESEQASTFLKLFSEGVYKYNPNGPHGPTRYYWTNAIEKLNGIASGAEIRMDNLRRAVLPFFVFILCAYRLCSPYIGRSAAWGACACFSMSSLAWIYSGYFVQEIIFAFLIFCTAASAWIFCVKRSSAAALLTGAFAAMALATKETAIISFASLAAAIICVAIIDPKLRQNLKTAFCHRAAFKYIGMATAAFAVCFSTLITSFWSNPSAIADFFSSYVHFFGKSGAADYSSPFFYYAKLLTLQKCEGAWFGELPITLLAIFGAAWAVRLSIKSRETKESSCVIFLLLNAAVCLIILSCIPYKTPWLLLSQMVFLCALAGYGMSVIFHLRKSAFPLVGFLIIALLGWWQLGLDRNCARIYHSDPRNPMLYSHTVGDAANLRDIIFKCASLGENGHEIPVAFVMAQSPWPMPWFLRSLENVGFWRDVLPNNISKFDIVISDPFTDKKVSAALDLSKYQTSYYGLRANLILTAYIKKELFDKTVED